MGRTLFLVGLIVFGLTAAAETPPDVLLERTNGQKIEGKLLTPTIRLKTEVGVYEIDSHEIKRLTFATAENPESVSTIHVRNKDELRGKVLNVTLEVQVADKTDSIPVLELREMKAVNKEGASLIAILIGLLTLTAMEIVLGVDNIIFLAIIAGKLPAEQQPKVRQIGLVAALGTRLLLLASLSFLLGLTKPVLTIPDLPMFHDLEAREVSMRDLILLIGGIFLIGKSVHEMHAKLEAADHTGPKPGATATFGMVLLQIAILDIVFSLDSVITAVGMVEELWVMIVAMIISMAVMLFFAGSISNFVDKHPTIKVLALAFLILIGVMLVAESLGQHINKGYIYFAMAFGVIVEMINIRVSRKKHSVKTT